MMSDKKIRTGIFGVAVVGLVLASTAGSAWFDVKDFHGPNIKIDHDFDGNDRNDRTNFVDQERSLDTFTKIKVLGGITLKVTAGGDQSVTVSTKEEHMDRVKTWVEGGTLYIETNEDKKRWSKHFSADLTVSVKALDALYVEGAIDGELNNITSENFMLDMEGAGNLEINGTCDTVTMEMSGAGNVDADHFKCKNATIEMSGVGNVDAYASESVDVALDGLGNVDVIGGATKISKRVGGFGDVSVR